MGCYGEKITSGTCKDQMKVQVGLRGISNPGVRKEAILERSVAENAKTSIKKEKRWGVRKVAAMPRRARGHP